LESVVHQKLAKTKRQKGFPGFLLDFFPRRHFYFFFFKNHSCKNSINRNYFSQHITLLLAKKCVQQIANIIQQIRGHPLEAITTAGSSHFFFL
jgi:alpha/beta superfamily hydrolase